MSKTPNLVETISPGKSVKSDGDSDKDVSVDFEGPPVVPDPRPYAYRRPVGHPEEDDTLHPLRRDSDFNPLR